MPSNSTTNGFGRGLTPAESFPGDHIGKVTPVPIPNTEVKLFEPMIVLTCAKVGIAGIIFNEPLSQTQGLFSWIYR